MHEDWIIDKNTLEKYIKEGQCTFIEWQVPKTKRFELYATIIGKHIRVATYSLKTRNVIITNPDWYIPTQEQLMELVTFAHQTKE